jgi:hypothetical protein
MKKLVTLVVLAVAVVGSAVAQMAIPGEVFGDNPARFNGRKVTIKNIQLVGSALSSNGSIAPAPLNTVSGPINVGQVGPVAPTATQTPCRPPRGFEKVEVFFKAKPEYKACFFMAANMKAQMDRELGGQNVDAQITFRGDYRTGYNVTFYRLGN